MLRPYKSKHWLVVGEEHGRFVNSWGVERCVNDIKRVCDTLEEDRIAIKKPRHIDQAWD